MATQSHYVGNSITLGTSFSLVIVSLVAGVAFCNQGASLQFSDAKPLGSHRRLMRDCPVFVWEVWEASKFTAVVPSFQIPYIYPTCRTHQVLY